MTLNPKMGCKYIFYVHITRGPSKMGCKYNKPNHMETPSKKKRKCNKPNYMETPYLCDLLIIGGTTI